MKIREAMRETHAKNHFYVSSLLSVVSVFFLQVQFGYPMLFIGILIGPVFYTLREIRDYKIGKRWGGGFDIPGLIGGLLGGLTGIVFAIILILISMGV